MKYSVYAAYKRAVYFLGLSAASKREWHNVQQKEIAGIMHQLRASSILQKTELVMFEDYNTINEAKMSLFSYIESFYNRKRRHSTIGYKTPHEYEELLLAA